MAIRINNAENFKGKAYVAADELDALIDGLTFAAGSAVWDVSYTKADGNTPDTTLDLTAIKTYIDNKAITVEAGAGVTIDTTNVLQPKIAADVDGTTIVLSGEGDAAKLAAGLTIAKLQTATTGFAASYQLQDANGTAIGSTIDIVKDQFLKDVVLGYGTFVDADTAPTGWTTTKDNTKQAILKLTFNTNTNGDDTAEDTKDVYILVDEMFHDKTAGNGIDATALQSNVIAVQVESATDAYTLYTAKGSTVDLFAATESGLKLANVQAAIDLAVNDEHAVAAAAISSVNDEVEAFESSVNSSVSEAVANVNTALTSTVASVNANVNSAVTAVNTNVASAVSGIQSDISATVTSVNGALESSVANVNAAVSGAVTKAVELVETSVSLTAGTTSGITVAVESGVVSVSGIAGNVLAVFDANGVQIEPEITKTGAGTAATNVLTADYGSASVDASWTVLHTKAIAYTDASYVSATAASTASYSDASYTSVTATAAESASAAAYDNSTTVAALSYKENA